MLAISLIAKDCANREFVLRQLDEIRVDVATAIEKIFTIDSGNGRTVEGNPVVSHAAILKGTPLRLVVSQQCATTKTPPYELVKVLADALFVTNPRDFPLLHLALSDEGLGSIRSVFADNGHHVDIDTALLGNILLPCSREDVRY